MGVAIGAAIAKLGTAAFWASAAVNLGISVGASFLIGKLTKSMTRRDMPGTELDLSGDPIGVRAICYGEAWTGGVLRYRDIAEVNNTDFYLTIVLAGHEIDSVVAVEANRQLLTLDGTGNVTAPAEFVGLLNIRFQLGSDTQVADPSLVTKFSPTWGTDHRLRGLPYAIVRMKFDEERMNTVPSLRFKLRGRKVYDPRLDSTNGGVGAHRLATPSTWTWSRNPILCANDFLRGVSVNSILIAGIGLTSARFSWPNVIAEANVCDENVALAAGGTEDRYTCDGFIDPTQEPESIVQSFERAIAGEILSSDGKWRFFCGAYRAPTLSLTDQHFIGPMRHVVHKGELDRVDTASGRYMSHADGGSLVNYAPIRLSTATTGQEREVEYDFALVADTTNTGGVYDGGARAQRIAKLLLEKEAAHKQIVLSTNLYGLRAIPGETISITHAAFGLTAQVMRVMEVQLRTQSAPNGGIIFTVDLVLEAGPSSLYTWSAIEVPIGASPVLVQGEVPPADWAVWTPVLVNVSQLGTGFVKSSGTDGAWDASVYSAEGFDSCSLTFHASQTNAHFVVGLNSDPTLDHTQASLDHAWYCNNVGSLAIQEDGVTVAVIGAYTVNDQIDITYDGSYVRYLFNGAVVRSYERAGARLFLDSSFYTMGAGINSLVFGSNTNVVQQLRAEMHDEFAYFTSTDLARRWLQRTGSAEINYVEGITDAPGGQAMRFGTGSGDDMWWGSFKEYLIPYDPNSTYEVGVILRRLAGVGTIVCGLEGVGPDTTTMINTAGANSYGSQHYIAANGASPPTTGWTKYVGYVRGHGPTVRLPSQDPTTPTVMYTGVTYIRPMLAVNYNAAAGQVDVAALWVRRLQNLPLLEEWTPNLVNVLREGKRFTKIAGSAAAFDASVYSSEGYTRCTLQWKAAQTNQNVDFGLDANPSSAHDRASLDYGLVSAGDGLLYYTESGTTVSFGIGYTTSDTLSIVYDGTYIRYYKNETLLRQVAIGTPNTILYIDSSFYHMGAAVYDVRFVPPLQMGTRQIDYEAATELASTTDAGPDTASATSAEVQARTAVTSIVVEQSSDVFEVAVAGRSRVYHTGSPTSPGLIVRLMHQVNGTGWVIAGPAGLNRLPSTDLLYSLVAITSGYAAGDTVEFAAEAWAGEYGGTGILNHELTQTTLVVTRVKR